MLRTITGTAWSSRETIMLGMGDKGYEYTRRSRVPVTLDIKDAVKAMAEHIAKFDRNVFWARAPFKVTVRRHNDYVPGHYVFTIYTEEAE